MIDGADSDYAASAVLSPCGRYRYRLTRRWGDGSALCFVMLNPSTADAKKNDPTIRKCIGFAGRNGYEGIEIVNLMAWRETNPSALRNAERDGCDVVGWNEPHVRAATNAAATIVCAWGANARRHRLAELAMLGMLRENGTPLHCLGVLADGTPRHPLMLPYSTPIELFGAAGAASRGGAV